MTLEDKGADRRRAVLSRCVPEPTAGQAGTPGIDAVQWRNTPPESTGTEDPLAKQNYRQAKRQKEVARKARQLEKLHKRSPREPDRPAEVSPDAADTAAPAEPLDVTRST